MKKRERLICIFFSSPDSFPPSNSALSLLRAAPAGCLDVARRDLSRRRKVSVPSPGEFSFVAAASGVPGRTDPFCVCLPGMVCTPLALRGHRLVFSASAAQRVPVRRGRVCSLDGIHALEKATTGIQTSNAPETFRFFGAKPW